VLLPLVIDLVVYSQSGFGVRIRYVLFLIPLFIFLMATGILFVERISGFKYKPLISIIIISLLIIPGNFTIYPDHFKVDGTVKNEFVHDINDLIETQNCIVIGSPPELLAFYFKVPEYWLVSNPSEIQKYARDGEYQYINSQILDNVDSLKKLEVNNSIIIIMEKANRWRFISPDVRDYISNNYVKYETYNQDLFDVYFKVLNEQ
jgi:phage pi2 protein 07